MIGIGLGTNEYSEQSTIMQSIQAVQDCCKIQKLGESDQKRNRFHSNLIKHVSTALEVEIVLCEKP